MTWKTIALSALLAPAALAANPPRGSFAGADYEAAKAKAEETGKPIAVVVTSIESTCPHCINGNAAVFKEMRSDYVLVVKDLSNKGMLPKNIENKTYEIYRSKGNIVPIVTVLSTQGKVLGGLCNKQIREDSRKAFRALKEEVAASLEGTPEKVPAVRDWTNVEGKTLTASVLKLTEETVTFELADGEVIEYPVAKLSGESREALRSAVPAPR